MGIINWLFKGNVLYYPGCLAKHALKEVESNYKEIFNLLGIDFIMLPNDEVCCGLPVINAGYKKEAKELAKKNFQRFKKNGIKKIITNCPSCYHMFKDEYPKFIPEWDIEVEHAAQTVLDALKKRDMPNYPIKEPVTYHDSCHLGRYCGIYNEPREVIELLGAEIIEMKHNKENALCCGAGACVRANFPELAKNAAKTRLKDMPAQVDIIISACSLCASNLQSGLDKNSNKKSEEFSQFVLRKLGEGR
jgi:Fe-S oxidoreductase